MSSSSKQQLKFGVIFRYCHSSLYHYTRYSFFLSVIIQIKDDPTANTELIVSPPTIEGLGAALQNKFNIQANLIEIIYKQSRKGRKVKMDDDLVRHYGKKGEWKLDVKTTDDSKYRIAFVQI